MTARGIRKKIVVITLAAAVASTAAGCSGKSGEGVRTETVEAAKEATETSPVNESAGTETSEAAAAAVQAEGNKTEIKASVIAPTVSVISGTVTDAGMSTVTIMSDKYPEGITFSKEDAATGFAEGLKTEQKITVFYTGEISNGDASGAAVELLRDYRDSDAGAQAAMMTGKVVSVGMSVISIETEDGRTASFEQDPKPVSTTDGLKETDRVTIVYSYQDEGGEGAIVPELIKNAPIN